MPRDLIQLTSILMELILAKLMKLKSDTKRERQSLERIDGTTPISLGLSFHPLQITTFWELRHLLLYCFISDMSLC